MTANKITGANAGGPDQSAIRTPRAARIAQFCRSASSRTPMQNLHRFLQQNFIWLFLFCLVWVVVGFGWRYVRHKRTGVVFPSVPAEQIRFEERTASGCSHKTMFTRLGGARNCLHVTVTDAEVWIGPIFPFSILAQQFDMEHRLPRASITRVQPTQSVFVRSLLLDYRDEHGQAHRLSLVLRKPEEFLRALSLQPQTV